VREGKKNVNKVEGEVLVEEKIIFLKGRKDP